MKKKRKKKTNSKSSVRKKKPLKNGRSLEKQAYATRVQRPISLVAQVEQTMRTAIADNVFPNDRLPTLIDLADQMHVSRETVRMALDSLQREGLVVKRRRSGTFINPPAVCQALKAPKRKILGYLIEAGYIDDYVAGSADGEIISQPLGGLMLAGAVIEAGRHNYQILTASAQPSGLREAFDQLNESGPLSGVILACVEKGKLLKGVIGRGIPSVILDHEMNVPKIGSVRGDSQQNARLAIHYLKELGHRKIACAMWRQVDFNPWFLRGYRQGLREENIKRRKNWEIFVELNEKGAAETLDQLMQIPESQRPTAIICFHNTFASQLVAIALKRGYKIPEDLSVLGGGGEEVMNLTYTQIDWQGLGRIAVSMLLKAIDGGEEHKAEHLLVPYELKAGETTAAIEVDE